MDTDATALVTLGSALDDAVEGGYLPDESLSSEREEQATRVRAAHNYLFLLGYLPQRPPDGLSADGNKSKQWHDQIAAAVSRFQTDARMSGTGVIDQTTWSALSELASFENATEIERWFDDEGPFPALQRAALLRLFAFGLSPVPPKYQAHGRLRIKPEKDYLGPGLQRFVSNAALLGLSADPLAPAFVPRTISHLFDQDRLVARLAATVDPLNEVADQARTSLRRPAISRGSGLISSLGGGGVSVYHAPNAEQKRRKKDRDSALDFVRHVARVEMWLYGYDVLVGNKNFADRFGAGATLGLTDAIRQFLRDNGDRQSVNRIGEGVVPGRLFAVLETLAGPGQSGEQHEDTDNLIDRIVTDKNLQSEVKNRIKTFAGRLWDGVKRLWRWFANGVKKVVGRVVRMAKAAITNISRFVFDSAQGIFRRISSATKGITDGINLLHEKVLRGSDPGNLYITHDRDFDFDAFIDHRADPSVVENLSQRVLIRAKIFQVASKTIGDLVQVFIAIARAVATTGWFAVLLALAKLRRAIDQLGRYADQQQVLLAQLGALQKIAHA